ncbi:hypothetical protein GCM10025779_29560 [Arthrobacter cryoconiti]
MRGANDRDGHIHDLTRGMAGAQAGDLKRGAKRRHGSKLKGCQPGRLPTRSKAGFGGGVGVAADTRRSRVLRGAGSSSYPAERRFLPRIAQTGRHTVHCDEHGSLQTLVKLSIRFLSVPNAA